MLRFARPAILALAVLVAALTGCNRPNLDSTGGGYAPDTTGSASGATPQAGTATPQ